MGTAILTMLMGSHAAIYISLTLIIENLLIVALMLILAEAGLHQQQRLLPLLKKHSLIYLKSCNYCNFSWDELHFARYSSAFKTWTSLRTFRKNSFASSIICYWWQLGWYWYYRREFQSILLAGFNVILMPVVIFGLFLLLPNVSQEMLYAGTLLAALPMPIAFGIFGQAYGLNERALTP